MQNFTKIFRRFQTNASFAQAAKPLKIEHYTKNETIIDYNKINIDNGKDIVSGVKRIDMQTVPNEIYSKSMYMVKSQILVFGEIDEEFVLNLSVLNNWYASNVNFSANIPLYKYLKMDLPLNHHHDSSNPKSFMHDLVKKKFSEQVKMTLPVPNEEQSKKTKQDHHIQQMSWEFLKRKNTYNIIVATQKKLDKRTVTERFNTAMFPQNLTVIKLFNKYKNNPNYYEELIDMGHENIFIHLDKLHISLLLKLLKSYQLCDVYNLDKRKISTKVLFLEANKKYLNSMEKYEKLEKEKIAPKKEKFKLNDGISPWLVMQNRMGPSFKFTLPKISLEEDGSDKMFNLLDGAIDDDELKKKYFAKNHFSKFLKFMAPTAYRNLVIKYCRELNEFIKKNDMLPLEEPKMFDLVELPQLAPHKANEINEENEANETNETKIELVQKSSKIRMRVGR